MQIVLPTEIKSFVEREVASGRYTDEQQVIVEALRRLADDEPDIRMTVAEAVAESLAQIERGEVVPYTEDFMREASARARENSRNGHKVSDDVKY
ncbi:MAG: type II toxin-antitoxin system ParD family antitoxin [Chloroflexota bacterium]|nr:type II toxin-antitoxin system ParD family antitoxin [Chloroflexota bacterium]